MSILLSRPLGIGWGGKGGWRGWAWERKTQDRILDTTLLEGQTQPLESDPDLEALGGEGRGHGVDGRVKKNERQDDTYYIARRRSTTWRNKSRPLGFGWGGERGNGVDWRVNTRRDCRYYIARRTNTALRNKFKPLGFGWGEGVVWPS